MTQLTTPTTAEIAETIVSQIDASLSQSTPAFARSFTRVLARALAGVVALLYRRSGSNLLQMFVATATDQEVQLNGRSFRPLRFWGGLIGAGDPDPGQRAELTIDITVVTQSGSVAAGTQLRGANGVTYTLAQSVLLNAATVSGTVQAVADQSGGGGRGAVGNLNPGATLTFAATPTNVENATTVTAIVVTGAEPETEDEYRERIRARFRDRPRGGAPVDYVLWTAGVPGVVDVLPVQGDPGCVKLYVEADTDTDPDGVPTLAQLQAVQDATQFEESGLATRRPVGALANALAITRDTVDVEVFGLVVDDPVTVQADIEARLDEYLRSRVPFVDGVSRSPRQDQVATVGLSSIIWDVVNANNGVLTSVNASDSGGAFDLRVLVDGDRRKLGTVTYT